MSIGGFIAVGGHGSNAQGSSTVSSLVVSIDKMDQTGNITTYDARNTSPELWRALRADLGMLGMTVSARLRIRDQFRVRQRILEFTDAEVFGPGGIRQIADQCEFIFATYFNSVGRMFVTCGNETTAPVTAEDVRMALFTPDFPPLLRDLAVFFFQLGACDRGVQELLERIFYGLRLEDPWLKWTDARGDRQRGLEAVGYAHRMTEITFRGVPQPKFSQRDWEVVIPESEIETALRYVKSKLEEYQLYNPAIGVVIRADQATADSLLAGSAVGRGIPPGERLYHLEFPIYWPYEFSAEQFAAYEMPYAEIILYLIENHNVRPHWGKNRNDIFWNRLTLASNADRRALFQPSINRLDPYGVFANEFLRNAGFSWPREGQDWVPVYFPGPASRAPAK
jgi:FAD/FMN-containing dehydrogenase